jgi:hypothetical protein
MISPNFLASASMEVDGGRCRDLRWMHDPVVVVASGDGETHCSKVRADAVQDGPSLRSQATPGSCVLSNAGAAGNHPLPLSHSGVPPSASTGLTRMIAPALYKNSEICTIAENFFRPLSFSFFLHPFPVCRTTSAAVHLAERRLVWRFCRPPLVHRVCWEHRPVLTARIQRWFRMEDF